ncbi:lymphocyte function-associated antigen 3-like isoform X2 [Dunckerocampus dactyliophorus]|nr:lymphocyte function-associated antigen 3-like isoform X2 [Dunckerocampus dactyliophorus]
MQAWLAVISVILTGCCTGSTIYKKVGDEVVLRPDAAPEAGPFTSIMWKHGDDIAIQWEGGSTEGYRQFKARATLNHASGELTIVGLTQDDSGRYTPEINYVTTTPAHLLVLSSVPEPAVFTSCDAELTTCTLTCAANTADAEPVTYTWKFGHSVESNSSKEYRIRKDSSRAGDISCELQNPVSRKASRSTPNPFLTVSGDGMKFNAGLTVFICLVTAVVLLVLLHKCRTGLWFFQKESNPWEADFWKRRETRDGGAVESNGRTSHHQETTRVEEETAMT